MSLVVGLPVAGAPGGSCPKEACRRHRRRRTRRRWSDKARALEVARPARHGRSAVAADSAFRAQQRRSPGRPGAGLQADGRRPTRPTQRWTVCAASIPTTRTLPDRGDEQHQGAERRAAPGRRAGQAGQGRGGHAHLPAALWRSSARRRRLRMAYYQTLFGTPTGKAAAVAGMRALAERNPGDAQLRGRAGHACSPTMPAHARRRHSHSGGASPGSRCAGGAAPGADLGLGQSASAAELRQYLKAHPQDTEVAQQPEGGTKPSWRR